MIIGIDANEANIKNRVGIGGFAFEILRELYLQEQINQNLNFTIYLKDSPNRDLPKEKNGWKYRKIGPKRFWTQLALPLDLYLHKPRPDVFFSTTHYAPRFCSVSSVISVMDLSYIHYPYLFKKTDFYQLKLWTSYSIRQAKRIITISNSSKDDIIKYYNLEPDKVKVIYPGTKKISNLKTQISNVDKLREKYKLTKKYILFVGTLQPRKNIERLVEAFAKFKSEDLELVIIGKKGWMYEEILKSPQKFKVENHVKFLDYVPDEDMPEFYKNAIFFVLPSLYEGFGLPVLEAMKYGCPVLASNVSSLPEAGGQAALYFDPEDVDDIVNKMKLVLDDKKMREIMREKGFEQVKKFSWKKAALQTLDILKETAGK